MKSHAGFTLIELSIVLVIIGLIVGGILVGRELIKAAEIRASISQIEKYRTALNTFRIKYGWLPGDMPPAQSTRFGFFAETRAAAGTAQVQDGNGYIQSEGMADLQDEEIIFWRHLSEAQLIDGHFGFNGNAAINPATGTFTGTVAAGQIMDALPPLKLGKGTYIHARYLNVGDRTENFFYILGLRQLNPNSYFSGLSPIEVSEMDKKLDDGLPLVGKFRGDCTSYAGAGSDQYDIGSTNSNTLMCGAQVEF